MILLDTNVLSELMRPMPEPKVLTWVDAQSDLNLWTSAITVAEIRLGIQLLPLSRRRTVISELAEQMFKCDFAGRCLPFDFLAADQYAAIVAMRTYLGRPISVEDAQIAAIASTRGLALATRNTKDFLDIAGLELIDPWTV